MIAYTCITGGYDTIKEQPLKDAPFFIVKPQQASTLSHALQSKQSKILGHTFFSHEYLMWIDGSMVLHAPCYLERLIDEHLKDHDVAVMLHPERFCVYEEGAACIKLGKADRVPVETWCRTMQAEGMPRRWGLAETGMILRRNNANTKAFFNLWWSNLLKSNTTRDQLSFTYSAWQYGLSFKMIPRRFFDVLPHNFKRGTR